MARKVRHEDEEEVAAPVTPCWLCGRPLGETIEWHHPVPKAKGGKGTVPVHPICHQAIHNQFSNADLARNQGSHEALLEKPEMQKFLSWVENKDPDFHAPTDRKRK